MDAKKRRELYRQESKERHEQNYGSANDTGRFKDIFEPSKKGGVKFYKCKEDDHELYIVPYIVGTKHPKLKEGQSDFILSVFVHRGIGINEDSYVCLNRTYGKKCPICEYQAELRLKDDADDATIKALNPTKRSIYNIVNLDSTKDEAIGTQVFDVSNYLFTIPLEEIAHKKRGGGEVAYAHIDNGKIISFRKKGTKFTTEFTAFEFKDRPEIPDEVLDAAVCLDELIHIPSYDEVHEAFWETKDKEVEETTRKPKEEPKEEKREEKTKEEPRKSKEEPEKEKDVPSNITECPSGAAYGKDYNEYEECRTCEVRSACRNKKDEIDNAAKPKEEPKAAKRLTRREK